jgi:hypothetical protein
MPLRISHDRIRALSLFEPPLGGTLCDARGDISATAARLGLSLNGGVLMLLSGVAARDPRPRRRISSAGCVSER